MSERSAKAWIMAATLALRGGPQCRVGDAAALASEAEAVLAHLPEPPLERWDISPQCVENHGSEYAAWYAATRELWEVFIAQRQHDPGVTMRLAISRVAHDGTIRAEVAAE